MLEEGHETQAGWESLEAPIDQQGATFYLSQNSRKPITLPDEMVPLWKILHLTGADWSDGGTAWAGENYCMFLADDEAWESIARATVNKTEALGCKVHLITECGHSTFSVNQGIRRFHIDTRLDVKVLIHDYAQWIRGGKLTPSSAWNEALKFKFTVQDPCNQVRQEVVP